MKSDSLLSDLGAPMQDGEIRIAPAAEAHREPLRAACAEDRDIWSIYSVSFLGEHFDPQFDAFFASPADRAFVIFDGERVAGMSSYLSIDARHRTLEIGRTYLVPRLRGTGFNARVKTLMLDQAFDAGIVRVEFRIDTRNKRSQAAVRKIGGVHEGVMRRQKITWNGYPRDTALFSILADEWRARQG